MNDKNVIVKTRTRNLAEEEGQNWFARVLEKIREPSMKTSIRVHPCLINGQETLIHERGLAETNPEGYRYLVAYAEANGYRLKEDQRADFIAGIKRVRDPGHANLMTIMVLAACVVSRPALAKSDAATAEAAIPDESVQSNDLNGLDMDLGSIPADEGMVPSLIGWINSHSSFKYNIHDVPHLQKVSPVQLAEIAFGGNLPKNINPANLKIYGLYNFNNKTVYLLDTVDLSSEEGKAILLHELVHYLQYQEGVDKSVQCKNELESLAYLLEARYMSEQHLDSGITAAHIQRAGQCPV